MSPLDFCEYLGLGTPSPDWIELVIALTWLGYNNEILLDYNIKI